MKNSFRISLLLAFLLASVSFSAQAQQPSTAKPAQGNSVEVVIEGKVIRVSDGDTIAVLDKDNKTHKIRFQGIDAPESKQDFGQVSKENLSKMVFGKQVTVLYSKLDKYGRVVGKVLLDGRDVNIEQVKAGLAWHYKKYESEQPPEDRITYAEAEKQARTARLGLWQDANPTPPGDWRVAVKEERAGPLPPLGSVVGNRNSKKYHLEGCPGFRDVAEKNRVVFKSVEEAEAAGYKRAGNCRSDTMVTTARQKDAAQGNNPSTPTTPTAQAVAQTPSTPAAKATTVAAPAAAAGQSTNSNTTTTAASGPVIGNKNSKIYHLPNCPGYDKVSEKNQVKFETAAEAEAAGYRIAKNCPKQ
jgi:endonuclease YncB( thermonuclease family)/methylphosphotriester-DNA--protein-cysteine methyltransferase